MSEFSPFDDDSSDRRGGSSPFGGGRGQDRLAEFLQKMVEELQTEGPKEPRDNKSSVQIAVREFEERVDVVIELGEFDEEYSSVALPNPTTLTIRAASPKSGEEVSRAIELPESVSMDAKIVVTNNKVMTVSLYKEDD